MKSRMRGVKIHLAATYILRYSQKIIGLGFMFLCMIGPKKKPCKATVHEYLPL
jgi:hypothetical protein